jgi:hypothetical protein
MARLRAPRKQVIWLEHSAHLPMIEEPGRVLEALLDHVRPLSTHRQGTPKCSLPALQLSSDSSLKAKSAGIMEAQWGTLLADRLLSHEYG